MKNFIGLLFVFGFQYTIAQCNGTEPVIDLGPDVTICSGTVLHLTPPSGYSTYKWSNGFTTQNLNVTTPGTYIVTATMDYPTATNLVLNGDFEAGTTAASNNFTTSYIEGTGGSWGLLSSPGQYAISTSPSLVHNNFSVCGDHTSGSGNMLIANGASTANTIVWQQTVTVVPGATYQLGYWAANAVNDPNVAQLQLKINGTSINSVVTTNTSPCVWTQGFGTWTAGVGVTTANLTIVNQSITGGGNDFCLDDIYFREKCVKKDTIVVAVNTVTVDAGPNKTFCENDSDTLVATTNNANNVLTWTANGFPEDSVVPTTSGYYVVTAVSPFGCTKKDSALVTIKAMNWEIDPALVQDASCGLADGIVIAQVDTVNTSLPAPLPFQYHWSGPGTGSTNSVNNMTFQNLDTGWYYLTVTSNGCSLSDSAYVGMQVPPIASFNANPTSGFAPLDVDFTNTSQNATSFYWNFGNGMDSLVSSLPDEQNIIYTDTGTYLAYLVAYSGGCSDTAFATIYVYPPIIPDPIPVYLPVVFETANVFTPNTDESNAYFTFKMENIVQLNVSIFNRWGNLVYHCDSPETFQWYGNTPEGGQADDGVYFYVFTATGAQNERFEGNGFLHLLR